MERQKEWDTLNICGTKSLRYFIMWPICQGDQSYTTYWTAAPLVNMMRFYNLGAFVCVCLCRDFELWFDQKLTIATAFYVACNAVLCVQVYSFFMSCNTLNLFTFWPVRYFTKLLWVRSGVSNLYNPKNHFWPQTRKIKLTESCTLPFEKKTTCNFR